MGSAEHPNLLRAAPPGRTYESLLHHFEIERSIAKRLKETDREGRKQIYSTMYDQLFAQVPDHPRLKRRADTSLTERTNISKARLLQPFVRGDAVFLEFGSGDCRFSIAMAHRFRQVHAVDIADQIGSDITPPSNFNLTIYDGYELDLPENSIDIAFSDQLIEHFHPEDTAYHFKLVQRLLKPGGVYLFRTPHRLTGPHDVSRYFSDHAQCFHLKEWTYGELSALLKDLGFRSTTTYWFGKGVRVQLPLFAFNLAERYCQNFRGPFHRKWLPFLFPSISIAAVK